jgi:multiple sugar transport system ATP-binding protein
VEAPSPSGSLSGNADVVEYLGNEELIHLSVGGHDIVALIGSEHRVKPGDDLTLQISLDKVHLFDPESTLALDKEREAGDIRKGGAARREEAPASV